MLRGPCDLFPVGIMPHVPAFPFLFSSSFPPPPSCRSLGQDEAKVSLNEAFLRFSTKPKDTQSAAPLASVTLTVCQLDPTACFLFSVRCSVLRRKAGPCLMELHPVDTKE